MRTTVTLASAVLAAGAALAGCGSSASSDSTSPTARTTTKAAAPSQALVSGSTTIGMGEFFFQPKTLTVKAGKLTITAANRGGTEHELVLLRTDADPARLPKKGGEVDESSSVGEIADVKAGTSAKHTFELKPGRYAMVCNLPGHYAGGMYGQIVAR